MTMYDKKQKESGKVVYTITGSAKTGTSTSAAFNSEVFNEKGKSISKSSGKYKCTGGILLVDAKVALPSDQSSLYQDAEVKAEDSFIEYPASMSSGQALKDASFKMDMIKNGSTFSTVNFEESERKVIGKESITTPAGTWECWKITFNAFMKVTMTGIGIPVRMQVTEWFAPGFGIVKTETANKNGKLMGSTMITKVQK